ncbi:MAG: hypothetical protein IPP27_02380 [Bacteroidetes bacterium]|nr:hypothetical protein [Bacteroidota bacterium]
MICNGNCDENWFEIIPSQCGVQNSSINGINVTQPIKIEVYNDQGVLIGARQGAPGENPTTLNVLLSANQYFIKLTCQQYVFPYDHILLNDSFTISLTYDLSDGCEM